MFLQPVNLVCTWRRFGSVRSVYEVLSAGRTLAGCVQMMRIRIVESGEEFDYHLADTLDNPRAG